MFPMSKLSREFLFGLLKPSSVINYYHFENACYALLFGSSRYKVNSANLLRCANLNVSD